MHPHGAASEVRIFATLVRPRPLYDVFDVCKERHLTRERP